MKKYWKKRLICRFMDDSKHTDLQLNLIYTIGYQQAISNWAWSFFSLWFVFTNDIVSWWREEPIEIERKGVKLFIPIVFLERSELGHHDIPRSLALSLTSSVLSRNTATSRAIVGEDKKMVLRKSFNCTPREHERKDWNNASSSRLGIPL